MGHANWWIPRWLDRLLPTIDIDQERQLPAPKRQDDHTSVVGEGCGPADVADDVGRESAAADAVYSGGAH